MSRDASSRRRRRPQRFDVPLEEDEVDSLIERRQRRENEEGQNIDEVRLYNARMLVACVFVIGAILITVQFIVVLGPPERKPSVERDKSQDKFGAAPSTAFVDDSAIDLIVKTMLAIDEKCIPGENDPVMLDIRNLQPAGRTNANLAGLFRRMRSAVSQRCDFYGLRTAEFRTDLLPTQNEPLRGISPADICHGYVHAGLTALLVREKGQIPTNLKEIADFIYFKAYPLNIFWPILGIPNEAQFEGILLSFLRTSIENVQSGGLEVTSAAKSFCNPYFVGPNEVNYYRNRTQPWLGFPFPGTMQRTGHNSVSPIATQILTNLTISTEFAIRKLYTLGDVLNNAAVGLFVDTLFQSLPREHLPDPDIINGFNTAFDEIIDDQVGFFLPDKTPIFILGRWAQDPSAYSSFLGFQSNILYGVTDVTSIPGATSDINVNVTGQSHAPDAISVLDFTTRLPYETQLGDAFIRELDVAEIIGTVVHGVNSLSLTETSILEDSFAVKGVIIDGEDIGLRAAFKRAQDMGRQQGFGTGFLIPAGSITMITDVQTEPTIVFGAAPLPQKFDWRDEARECIGPVLDQGQCNSCWAVSTGDALGSRACIKGLTSRYTPVSVQHITSCAGDSDKDGCVPDSPYLSFTFTSTAGAVDSRCFPYQNAGKSREVSCRSICDTTSSSGGFSRVTTDPRSHVNLRGVETIKREIFTNGPVPIGFEIPLDLCEVVNGGNRLNAVYSTPNIASTMGGSGRCGQGAHLVVAVGWDDTASDPYWIIKNSWGSNWGHGGYFRVRQNLVGWLGKEYPWFEQHAYVASASRVQDFGTDEAVPVQMQSDPKQIVNEEQSVKLERTRSAAMTDRPSVIIFFIVLIINFIVFA